MLREDDADEAVDVFPSQTELESAALGDEPVDFDEEETEPPIRVAVCYGDLAYASQPVAVGHYQGDPIVSAERALDRQLGGRLSRRYNLGRYPGPIGTSEVILDRREDAKPGGAIVVGLGRVGELSRGSLADAFTEAVLSYVLKLVEERPDESHDEIEIVTLLIGSSEAGLTIEESIEAMFDAVLTANYRLLDDTSTERPLRIGKLTFVELYQDLAVQALHSIRRLAATNPDCEPADELFELEAGRRRVFIDPDPRWWLRLVIQGEIEAAKEGAGDEKAPARLELLKFSLLGDRARAETLNLAVNPDLVDGMIQDAMHNLQDDPEVGKTLFELLLPNYLKLAAPKQRHLVLAIDDQTARFPWELMVDRTGGDDAAGALQGGLIRQLFTEEYREQVLTPTATNALVIGDPPSNWAELPGAQEEARGVTEWLETAGFDVTSAIQPSTAEVLKTLFTEDYRVLHLAGHGDYKPGDKNRTGMVIGTDRFLTPAVIEQMRQVPELVFINCCHLGYIDSSRQRKEEPRAFHRLAANLGAQLIRMGVRAVVAAGWPVDDHAALTFARTFYERMLAGTEFGMAVLEARKATYWDHANSNTWGAYQCYGDPAYRLVRRKRHDDGDDAFPFVAPFELIASLDNVVSSARAKGSGSPSYLNWLDEHERFPRNWRQRADVATAFGRAYAEIGEYESAVHHYRRATELEDGLMTLKDIEQLGNMEVRFGRKAGDADAIRAGLERLLQVLDLGPTSERWSLLGGSYKRLAIVTRGKERLEALEKMGDAYKAAYEMALDKTGEVDTYPLLNYVTARVLLRRKDDGLGDLPALLRKAEEAAPERLARRPTFWNAVIGADAALVRYLAAGKLSQKAKRQEVVDGFLAGKTRAASPREFDSVVANVKFMIAMRSDPALTRGRSERAKRARADVEDLEKLLVAMEALPTAAS